MNVEEFDYELPDYLIAQTPLKKRDESRLLVLDKATGEIEHKHFSDIVSYLKSGDALVLNDTKVMPARLIGIKEDTNAAIEMLLLKEVSENCYETLVKPARRIKEGTIVTFGNGLLKATCIKVEEEGIRHFKLVYEGIFYEVLEKLGTMPLPPYIHEQLEDKDRYNTVYAKNIGSAAAPTAGLHFTNELLLELSKRGISIVYVTLHVGLGTFRPVSTVNIYDHHMHSEYYQMGKNTAEILVKTKESGHDIIAVGTTSVRTLETIMNEHKQFKECSGWTNIFIYPGYTFKAVDHLITNFHLPKSTLIMLISAFSKRDIIINSYNVAVEEEYRFFSFGDSMFIN